MRLRSIPQIVCLAISAFGILDAALGQSAERAVYRSDFGKDFGGFRELWRYYGKADLALDPAKRGAAGAPSLRVTFTGKTKTMVGVQLPLRSGQRLRVEVEGSADLQTCDGLRLCLRCNDSKGKRTDWITFGDFPRTGEPSTLKSMAFEVAPSTAQAHLFVFAVNVTGGIWISDVHVTTMEIPPEIEAGLSAKAPTTWGINDFFAVRYANDPTLSDTCAKLMATAGFTEARLFCWWGGHDQLEKDIQPNSWICLDRKDGRYDFSELDQRLKSLAHYGLRPGAVVVHGTPEWASGKTSDDIPDEEKKNWRARRRPFFPPRDWADYEHFVSALISHFKDRVRIWEVGNEPNTPDSGFHYGYHDYMKYLQRFYTAAKKADPQCTVLCGRVGADWIAKMLEEDIGIAQYFDGLVSHPYASSPEHCFAKVRREQLAMAAAGVIKPIYVTEIGFGEWHKTPSPAEYEQEKARNARGVLPLMVKVSDHVYWWTSVRPGNQHGLLRDDGYCYRPMPVYWEVGRATGRLLKEGGPVKAEVHAPTKPVAKSQGFTVQLTATNTSAEPQRIRFWPVGLVSALGVTIKDVKSREWNGVLPPGGEHTETFRLSPPTKAEGGVFPTGLAIINSGGDSLALADVHVRSIASMSRASASAGSDPENLAALNDRVLPFNSWDLANLYFVWPGRKGTLEWVRYDFGEERRVSGVDVFWLDTRRRTGDGRVPQSWRVLYRDGEEWRSVSGAPTYGVAMNKFNKATFTPVETTALRLEVQLQAGFTGGIHEWRVLE